MGTNDSRQDGKSGNRYNQDFTPESLLNGCDKTCIPMNKVGNVYRMKGSVLQASFEDMVVNTYHIDEIDHVAIMPKFDRNQNVQAILCRAYFDTKDVSNGDIVRKGYGAASGGGSSQTILPFIGGATTGQGDFELSKHFKEVFTPLSISDDDQLRVGSIPRNRNIACLDIDFFAFMTLALGIESDSPYDFTVLGVEPIGSKGNGDYLYLISKYIDTRSGKRGRHKKNRVDYATLDREWANSNDAYSNARRSF